MEMTIISAKGRMINNLTGKRFGRLKVICYEGVSRGNQMWVCECDCGKQIVTRGCRLTSGATKSCGCWKTDTRKIQGMSKTHGMSNTRIYNIWVGMIGRGRGTQAKKYYYDRGIRVCDEWKKFEEFYKWAVNNGYSDNLTLDRINVCGDYEPSNCRWVTMKEQNTNKHNSRFMTFDGETKTMGEWSKILGIPATTMIGRRNRGWTDYEILTSRRSKEV